MSRFLTHKNGERAFTLIELIVAVVILGILASAALLGFRATVDRSTDGKQRARTLSLLREARTLYVQKIYVDPSYTWQQALVDSSADLPPFRTNALTEGVLATGGSNLNTSSNGWSIEADTGAVVYSTASSEIVFKVQLSTLYVASRTDATGNGVFGYVSQDIAPVVWSASCSGSSCDAESAAAGPPSSGGYAPGTTTPAGPTIVYASSLFSTASSSQVLTPTVSGSPTSYSYSGVLPAGVTFNTSNGTFTGPASWNVLPSVLSVGQTHGCVVLAGSAKCWGDNTSGKIGDGTTIPTSNITQVSGLTANVTGIAAGSYHTCAVVAGAVKCWGQNGSGQLGDGTTTASSSPVQVTGLTSGVTAIATGAYHSCAIVAGAVKCWGQNGNGQLGDGTTTARSSPVQVTGLTSGVTAIATGAYHTCAVVAGAVKCWGQNSDGQLGIGSTSTAVTTPAQTTGLTSGMSQVTGGTSHSCASSTAGSLVCWGSNNNGQLGDGTTTSSSTPIQVVGLTSGVTGFSAGATHSCAVVSGSVMCWGNNVSGQLGDGTTTYKTSPTQVSGVSAGGTLVATGNSSSCAVYSSGGLRCWGQKGTGQLGDGTSNVKMSQTQVSGLTSGVSSTGVGAGHSCVVLTTGAIKCWGQGTSFALGDGLGSNSTTPVQVSGITSGATQVVGGRWHACAVVSGAAKCWGDSWYGQLGDGSTSGGSTPVQVSGLTSGVTSIAAGTVASCAVVSGSVKCWGQNNYGQLGNGTTTASYTPVQVSGLTSGVTQVAAGNSGDHFCALLSSGSVKCWGSGSSGQLGNGAWSYSTTPVQVTGLTSGVTYVAAGDTHSCAIASGSLKCWGQNSSGQLGDGTTMASSTPVQVSGLTSGVSTVTGGSSHTCAAVSGAAKCWGSNNYGQLGNGTATSSTTPVQVTGLTAGVTSLGAGQLQSCAVVSGAAKCWGSNSSGEVGSGESSLTTSPSATSVIGNSGTPTTIVVTATSATGSSSVTVVLTTA